MVAVGPAFLVKLVNLVFFHGHPLPESSFLVGLKLLVELPQQICVDVLEQLGDIILSVLLHLVLEALYELSLFLLAGLHALHKYF